MILVLQAEGDRGAPIRREGDLGRQEVERERAGEPDRPGPARLSRSGSAQRENAGEQRYSRGPRQI